MSFWNFGKSNDSSNKIDDLKKQLQNAKQERDFNRLKKKSDSISKDLWNLKEKIRKRKEEIGIEKEKLQTALYNFRTLESNFFDDANGITRDLEDKITDLKYHEQEYQRKSFSLFQKLGEYFQKFCNAEEGYPYVNKNESNKKLEGMKMEPDEKNPKTKPEDFSLRNRK